MKIYLFLDRTALFIDDKQPTVTVEPACAGALEIEGRRYAVAASGTRLPIIPGLNGSVKASFITDKGDRYEGIQTYMASGVPWSRIDYATSYANTRIHLDELERQVDKLTESYHALMSEIQRDALGFLTHNTKRKEVQ